MSFSQELHNAMKQKKNISQSLGSCDKMADITVHVLQQHEAEKLFTR
jgi:hypothetical protein